VTVIRPFGQAAHRRDVATFFQGSNGASEPVVSSGQRSARHCVVRQYRVKCRFDKDGARRPALFFDEQGSDDVGAMGVANKACSLCTKRCEKGLEISCVLSLC
jgi:hypothetical protein